MTGMLASVTSAQEAQLVLKEGVDIVDLKNPEKGALGALDTNVVAEIIASIDGAVLTSATVGDIEPDDPSLKNKIIDMANTGVDFVKVGLFDSCVTNRFIQVVNQAAGQGVKLIVVLFAENISNISFLDELMKSDISGVMLDTKNKSNENLCSLLSNQELEEFVRTAKSNQLLTGLAGSLRIEDIATLLDIEPDYLGFRGALCSGHDRVKSIDPKQIKKIRNAIPQRKIIDFKEIDYPREALIDGSMA
jgi:(5-formylfuran-3-yl)methyl phosphate synthase